MRVHLNPPDRRHQGWEASIPFSHARADASRAEGASPRARVPPVDYADKLPPMPVVHFYAAAPVHNRAAVDSPWHYVPILARKPGTLRNGAPFKGRKLLRALDRMRRRLAGRDDGDRQFVRLLAAVQEDGLAE